MAAELYTRIVRADSLSLIWAVRFRIVNLPYSFLLIQLLWELLLSLFELPSLLYTQLLPLVECIYTTCAHLPVVSPCCIHLEPGATHVDDPHATVPVLLQSGTLGAVVRIGYSWLLSAMLY